MVDYCDDFLIDALHGFGRLACAAIVKDEHNIREAALQGFSNLAIFGICKLLSSDRKSREQGKLKRCSCSYAV